MKTSRLLYVLFFLVLVSQSTASTIQCRRVVADLEPCLSFLQGKEGKVLPQCCAGVKDLTTNVKTKADRVASCNCWKHTLLRFHHDPHLLPLLPKICEVDATMPPIYENYDCSKVPV